MLPNLFDLLFADIALKEKTDLSFYEMQVYSQNGEDGVIGAIFRKIKTTNRFFVEFGVETGGECNTLLLYAEGWKGLLMDLGYSNPKIGLYQETVTAENINALFKKYQVPLEFDLLSIDVDRNDFYLWMALNYRPRIVVIEFNATLGPSKDKVVLYDPHAHWDFTNYFGASLLAFYKLGRKKGYSLIYADRTGTNLFFIKDDVLKQTNAQFKNINQVKKIYRPLWQGFANDPLNRPYTSSAQLFKDSSTFSFRKT